MNTAWWHRFSAPTGRTWACPERCRDRCGDCTFASISHRQHSLYLEPNEVPANRPRGRGGRLQGGHVHLGDKPEDRWRQARGWLDAHGYDDTPSYARATVIRVLEETGPLTHLNPGRHVLAGPPAPQAGRPVHGHDARPRPPAASKRTKLLVVGVAKTQGEVRALRGVQKLESPLSQPARGGQVDRANAANRRRNRSSSGSPRRRRPGCPAAAARPATRRARFLKRGPAACPGCHGRPGRPVSSRQAAALPAAAAAPRSARPAPANV
jgi:hypothetical protein